MNGKQIFGLVAGVGTVITVIVAMLWGVPYYIDIKVEQRVNTITTAAGKPPAVVQLELDVAVINTKLDAIAITTNETSGKLDTLAINITDVYKELARL